MNTLPTLFFLDAKNMERFWKVSVDDNTMFVEHGVVDGKSVSSIREFLGKNIGRSNETSPQEQALLEARRDWIKKLDGGYKPKDPWGLKIYQRIMDQKSKQNGSNIQLEKLFDQEKVQGNLAIRKDTQNLQNIPESMLCKPWDHVAEKNLKLSSGAFLQPKLDGVRALAALDADGKVHFYSRGKKEYPFLDHLREEILCFLNGDQSIVLDGEIYAHCIKGNAVYKNKKWVFEKADKPLSDTQRFDVIAGLAKPTRSEPHPLEDQLEFHIFDIYKLDEPNMIQKDRLKLLDELFENYTWDVLQKVPTHLVKSFADIEQYHGEFSFLGYEGVIIRSQDGVYGSGKRPGYIRKFKDFQDAEYIVCGVECKDGVGGENFVWVFENEAGKKFKAKPMGTVEQRLEWYENHKDYIGKSATVRYQGLTKEGVPRFPRCVGIRYDL